MEIQTPQFYFKDFDEQLELDMETFVFICPDCGSIINYSRSDLKESEEHDEHNLLDCDCGSRFSLPESIMTNLFSEALTNLNDFRSSLDNEREANLEELRELQSELLSRYVGLKKRMRTSNSIVFTTRKFFKDIKKKIKAKEYSTAIKECEEAVSFIDKRDLR